MANKKISELNQAGSLGANDEFAVVQGTETKKTSLNEIANGVSSIGGFQNVQADWDESNSSSDAFIKNKPSVEQSDWDETDTNSPAFIKNKPQPVAVPFAGNYDYVGYSTTASPLSITQQGQVVVHELGNNEFELCVSSYDLNGYPFAFYLEASTTNQEDDENIFSNRFTEGSLVTMLLTDGIGTSAGGAITGIVKSVARSSDSLYFIVRFSGVSSFGIYNPSNNCSLHVESDLTYSRYRAWINNAQLDASIGGGLPVNYRVFKPQTFITEPSELTFSNLFIDSENIRVNGSDLTLTGSGNTISIQGGNLVSSILKFENEVLITENVTITSTIPVTLYFRVLKVSSGKILTQGSNVTIKYEYINDSNLITGSSVSQESWFSPNTLPQNNIELKETYNFSMTGTASSTVAKLYKSAGVGKATTDPFDPGLNSGFNDPYIVHNDSTLSSIRVNFANAATSGFGTNDPSISIRLELFKVGYSTRTLIATIDVPLTNTSGVGVWANLAGNAFQSCVKDLTADNISLTAGDLIGVQFTNVPNNAGMIDAVGQLSVSLEANIN